MSDELINVAQVEQVIKTKEDKVKVKLKRGDLEIEVESTVDRISDVISRVIEGLSKQKIQLEPSSYSVVKHSSRRREGHVTCRGLIEELWREGWFSEPRTLSEVVDELSRRGYNYNSTAVSHSLTDLTRSGVLTRLGTPRTYRYVQKRPPS